MLADDPPLLLWVVCGPRPADCLCRSVDEAAGWLAQHALLVLQWPAGQSPPGEEAPAASVWAQRVAAAVALSDVAAQVAGDDPADREAAILGGLLYYADDWLRRRRAPGLSRQIGGAGNRG